MSRITLVAPGLLALPDDVLARSAALSRIAALAPPVAETDVESATLADAGLPAAPAPLAALGAGFDPGDRWILRADPVSIVVGRDDARIEDVVDDLTRAEADVLLALLNAHSAEDGIAFVAPRPDAWFAAIDTPQSLEAVAADRAIGVPLRPLLPSGADAARWRRLLTETQMLLHDHPLAARRRPVNSMWFSGGGTRPAHAALARLYVHASSRREGDVVRGLARANGVTADDAARFEDVIAQRGFDLAIVASSRIESPEALATFERDVLVPSLDALQREAVASVKLIASDGHAAASWTAGRTSWLRRWMRRRSRFALPARLEASVGGSRPSTAGERA